MKQLEVDSMLSTEVPAHQNDTRNLIISASKGISTYGHGTDFPCIGSLLLPIPERQHDITRMIERMLPVIAVLAKISENRAKLTSDHMLRAHYYEFGRHCSDYVRASHEWLTRYG
jgi:hypothetical protein